MKKFIFILLIACVAFVGCSEVAEARGRCRTTAEVKDNHNVVGVKIDAPNLVKIDKEGKWTLGAEGGKEIMKNLFYNDNDFLEADRGYFAFVKVTYKGCLLRCNQEE